MEKALNKALKIVETSGGAHGEQMDFDSNGTALKPPESREVLEMTYILLG